MSQFLSKPVTPVSLCLLVAAALSGCIWVSMAEYPDSWARLGVKVDGCPDLTGSYKDDGEIRYGDGNPQSKTVRLSVYLFQSGEILQPPGPAPVNRSGIIVHQGTFENSNIDRTTITGPREGKLHVVAWNREEIVAEIDLSQGSEFKCEDGFLLVRDSIATPLFPLTIGVERVTLSYMKTTDGALIAHGWERGGGILFFVPTWGADEAWIRFPSTNPKDQNKPPQMPEERR